MPSPFWRTLCSRLVNPAVSANTCRRPSPKVLIVGRQGHRCIGPLARYSLDPVPDHAGRFQETSGTATSEEYDKVSHGDVQSVTSHSGSPNKTGQKSDDNSGNSEAPPVLFWLVVWNETQIFVYPSPTPPTSLGGIRCGVHCCICYGPAYHCVTFHVQRTCTAFDRALSIYKPL